MSTLSSPLADLEEVGEQATAPHFAPPGDRVGRGRERLADQEAAVRHPHVDQRRLAAGMNSAPWRTGVSSVQSSPKASRAEPYAGRASLLDKEP